MPTRYTRAARSLIVPPLASLLALLAAFPRAAAGSELPARVAVESVSAAGLEIAIQRPFESARLVIRRIGGEVVHRGTYPSTPIQLFPRLSDEGEVLEDGAYVYELLVHPPDEAEPGSDSGWGRQPGADEPPGPAVVSDLFELRDGRLVSKGETAAEAPDGSAAPSGNGIRTRDSEVNDDLIVEGSLCASDSDLCEDGETFLSPVVFNAQLKLKDTAPLLWFNDTSAGEDDWVIRADLGTLRIQNADTGNDAIFIEEGANDSSLYINFAGEIGLGTAIPEDPLHLVHTDPTIHLEETDQDGARFRLRVDTSGGVRSFSIRDGDTFDPFLFIDQDSGRVGLGTGSPAVALDIAPRDGNADLRLASATGSWIFANRGEVMTVSREGSGGEALEIHDRFDAAGPTLVVQGSVQGTQVVNTSSREIKTGFAPVDPAAMLAGLSELPVTTWRYRHEPRGARHIGPVAEDFRARFGLGDGRTISTVDAVGVLMAAVQALHAENRALQERFERLEGGGGPSEAGTAEPVPADILAAGKALRPLPEGER